MSDNLAHMAYDAFNMASRMDMPPYDSIGPAQMHWIAVALVVADAERARIAAAVRQTWGDVNLAGAIERGEL